MSVGHCRTSDAFNVTQNGTAVKQHDAGSTDNEDGTAMCNEAPGEEQEEDVKKNEADDSDEPEVVTELNYREHSIETMKDDTFEIRGLTVTRNPGHILVADHGNNCIKYVDYHFNVIHRHPVVFEPWDVCVVDEIYIVVTFPFVRLMQYLKFKNKSRIIPWFPVKSRNEYYGVCADRERIIATCKYDEQRMSRSPSVHVMDRDGNVEIVIEKDGRGDNIFTDPDYIALDSSTQVMFVSDQGSKQIVSLNMSGRILARFATTSFEPKGVTVDNSRGNVFVCCQDSVILLNQNLKKLKTMKCKGDKIHNVQAVTYCSKTDRLILSTEFSGFLRVSTV